MNRAYIILTYPHNILAEEVSGKKKIINMSENPDNHINSLKCGQKRAAGGKMLVPQTIWSNSIARSEPQNHLQEGQGLVHKLLQYPKPRYHKLACEGYTCHR